MEMKFMQLNELEEMERKLRTQMNEVAEKVRAAKAEKRSMEKDALKPLTIKAHGILCGYNHTDGCGWGYESHNGIHDWEAQTHARWLEHVEKWLEHKRYGIDLTIEKLDEILDHVAAGKKMHKDYLFLMREVIKY